LKKYKSGPAIVVAVCMGTLALYCASTRTAVHAANDNDPSTQAKIASAISAGPEDITRGATIAEMDAKGSMTVIRKGTNEWTCMPGDPNSVAVPPMCEDRASMQWDYAFRRHLPKPLNTVPGITYMLAGAEQRSDTDPYDKTTDQDRAALDDHVALRSKADRTADEAQASRCLHHVGRLALCACPRHGKAIAISVSLCRPR
jgi:hypothetical protein